jgi:hypothetical protein
LDRIAGMTAIAPITKGEQVTLSKLVIIKEKLSQAAYQR